MCGAQIDRTIRQAFKVIASFIYLKQELNLWLVECYFTSTETVGLLGTGALDVHFDFHTAPEL